MKSCLLTSVFIYKDSHGEEGVLNMCLSVLSPSFAESHILNLLGGSHTLHPLVAPSSKLPLAWRERRLETGRPVRKLQPQSGWEKMESWTWAWRWGWREMPDGRLEPQQWPRDLTLSQKSIGPWSACLKNVNHKGMNVLYVWINLTHFLGKQQKLEKLFHDKSDPPPHVKQNPPHLYIVY